MEGSYVVKIKEMLMILQAGDASDHWDPTKRDEEPDGQWYHDSDGCNYCAAARAAEHFAEIDTFEAGDKVMLPGGIPGRVMGTDITVRVEVQNGEHGPWAVGSFSPHDLTPRTQIALEHTWWSDSGNAVWQRHEASKKMLLVRDEDGQPTAVGGMLHRAQEWPRSFETVDKRWGPLTQVDKP